MIHHFVTHVTLSQMCDDIWILHAQVSGSLSNMATDALDCFPS